MTLTAFPLAFAAAALALAADEYKYGADSSRQPGVPQGKVTQSTFKESKIFPGTVRDYWIYVPAQYKPDQPAALMVFQDGGGYVTETGHSRIPIVFDNLIHRGDMPVTIGVFVSPGVVPARHPAHEARFNRSVEYDSVNDRYARFLIDEFLPEATRPYNITSDPNLRAISGGSSGAIAAFTVAWHRPDAFRRVLSFIGSYTNLRGGQILPSLIRKTEPKPLRVFLQDGVNDNNIYAGSWWVGNQDMHAALKWAGYEVEFVTGTEAHNMKHGGPLMPDALRWLWRGAGTPIAKSRGGGDRQFVTQVLDPAGEWELVSQGHRFTEGPAVNRAGEVFFTDIPNNRIHRIGLDGKVTVFKEDSGAANGLMFGPDGRLYACQNGRRRIVAYSPDGAETTIAEDLNSNDLAVNAKGEIYVSDPANKRIWFIDAQGRKRVVHEGIEQPNGVILSTDHSLLTVADSLGRLMWSFQVAPDGSLTNGQQFHRLETSDESSATGADGMTVDSEGYLYVATRLGLQVLDQPGRTVGIVNKPHPGSLSNAVFGGPALDTLYVTAGDRVYKRPMRRKGVWPWQAVKPPRPGL
ncbi:MAG: gluconolactonase [Acidobacteria bacterium]|nr:gluconolactonase [Acidobacteriota bacterium]